jgi:hypothetical protein
MTDLLRIQVPDEAGWRVDYKYLNAIEDHMVDNGEPASLEQIEAVILAIAAINDAELEAQRAQPQVEPSELAMMLRTIAGQVQGGLKFSTQAGKDEYARVINEAADALAVAQPQAEPSALQKAADTFADLARGLRLLRHPVLAEACEIAERETRAAIAAPVAQPNGE